MLVTDISVARRRPTEQVLRPKVVAISAEARTETDRLVNFVFDRTLRIEAPRSRRSSKLKWRSRIERDDRVIRSALPNRTVCKHCRRRVQSHSPAACAGWPDVSRERGARQTCVRLSVVAGPSIRSQCADVTAPWNPVKQDVRSRQSPHWQRHPVWSSRGIAETNLDCDRIAEQRFVERDRPVNHRLNGGRIWIARNGTVKRWMNRQTSSRLSRNRSRFRIACWRGCIVSANPVVIRRAPAQPGHYSPGHVTNVEVVIPVDKSVKRAARGRVQQISLRAPDARPRCHKTASRGRWRRNRFSLGWKFVRVWKLQRGLRFRAGLMPECFNFKLRCPRRDRLG
jgi:hypothetical protein